jgi:hypothetical protein
MMEVCIDVIFEHKHDHGECGCALSMRFGPGDQYVGARVCLRGEAGQSEVSRLKQF